MTVGQKQFTDTLLDARLDRPAGLVDPNGRPAGKRFDVYRNNVVYSLIDAMKTAFPVIHKLLGDAYFQKMANIYVRKFPPTSPMMMFYGAELPSFLEGFEPLKDLPYLADVARLELARRRSYHAADHDMDIAKLMERFSPDQLLLTHMELAPTVQIISSPYPIVSIWNFNMIEGAPKPSAQAETVLITRPQFDVEMLLIDQTTADFIQNLSKTTLGDAYETALTVNPDFNLGEILGMMLSSNMIAGIKLKGA